jgi:GNAT superfamily N-acetyltransferase
VIIAETVEGASAGFALFFHNFSTWAGKPGIYLEDLFVRPELRGHGYGKALLSELARLAVERGCARLEWAVLDWNEPSIQFYKALGAVPMDEWTTYGYRGRTDRLARAPESAVTGTTEGPSRRARPSVCGIPRG